MRLIVMNIPDQAEALPGWLERRLVGLDLAELVKELAAIHPEAPTPPLDDVLGNKRLDVLQNGLGVLPISALRQLLLHPQLLLNLQELVLEQGGAHWGLVDAGGETEIVMQRGEQRLLAAIRQPRTVATTETVTMPSIQARIVSMPPLPDPALNRPAWYRRPWVVSLATAAVVMVAVAGLMRWLGTPAPRREATAWGWNKPDAMPANASAPEYLNTLANGANEWFRKQPQDAPEVAQRIGEFRVGCSKLILASHKPLKDEDREWLLQRCKAWAKKFDEQLAALEKGEDPIQVRMEMDAIVNQLVKALQTRAEEVAAATASLPDSARQRGEKTAFARSSHSVN